MTGTQARPTIKRRRIGALLRQYREAHPTKILSKTAARHIGVEPSHLGRIERGEYRIKPAQIEGLLGLYGIDDHTVFMELRRAALEPVDAGWWYPYRRELSPSFLDFITLENEATMILSVSPSGIPGLLQCPAYAREVQEQAPTASIREQSDLFVSVRLARQQAIMRTKDPVQLRCIMAESTFHSESSSIADQLQHLLSVSRQDNIRIQVMPMSAPVGLHIDVQSTLMKFREPWPHVSYAVGMSGGVIDDSPETARGAQEVFSSLEEAALTVDRTREFMKERLEKIEHGI